MLTTAKNRPLDELDYEDPFVLHDGVGMGSNDDDAEILRLLAALELEEASGARREIVMTLLSRWPTKASVLLGLEEHYPREAALEVRSLIEQAFCS
jgi:hypothetical protein